MNGRNDNNRDLKRSYQYFNKLLGIFLIIGIIVISSFIIYSFINPEPGYTTFGILNSEKEAGNYPTNVNVDENVSFFLTVGNYLSRDFTFRLEILKGNNETILSAKVPSINSTSYLNSSELTLHHSENWISNMFNISFSSQGTNQYIIAELWEIKSEVKFINAIWLKLNITA